ncbi:MAG: anthranilate synthase component I family protein [Capnocytophaga sp.]|nr:anthranilate synthase component I family protein [Capnocytophaga sp.]
MQRIRKIFYFDDLEQTKTQVRRWCDAHYDTLVWLDSNSYPDPYSRYEAVLAFDPEATLQTQTKGSFDQLKTFVAQTKDWLFGYLTYDLKNDLENLNSRHEDPLQWAELFFFQPRKIIFFKNKTLIFNYLISEKETIDQDWETIQKYKHKTVSIAKKRPEIQPKLSKKEYCRQAERMRQHIFRGDIYEANFCQEFYAENAQINPANVYERLNSISRPPFATYLKKYPNYLISASPERYIRREGTHVISQPIKGTAKRSEDSITDEKIRNSLINNPKERSENIMIVDLVRNDMSRFAQKGSVKVDELCQAYTFRQVHQLISTVTARANEKQEPVELIRATFPMGSMTGAPKIAAMQLIDQLEYSRRGLYSGTVGYFTPEGDFDFNVVIRSILYNEQKKYVSYSVGSAITAQSDIEAEYEECLLKASAMKLVLEYPGTP